MVVIEHYDLGKLSSREAWLFERSMPVPECGCWIWMGATNGERGYGSVNIGKKLVGAHRLSWEIHNGSIPKGQHVLHKCDTPLCVNPEHLFLGTHTDNMRDKYRKRREGDWRGTRNGKARLTSDDVRTIRNSSLSQAELSRRIGVSPATINHVLRGRSWSHVP
jgi:hypothetical protein